MNQQLAHIAIVVSDYDEAIAFYVDKLGFILVETQFYLNQTMGPCETTWFTTALLLAKAANENRTQE